LAARIVIYMTQNRVAATDPTTAEAGTVIARRDLDFVRIDIVKAVGGFGVIVWTGATKVAGWVDSYEDWETARNAANHARCAFRIHGTVEAINNRRNQLAIQRVPLADRLDRSRNPQARHTYTAQIEAIDAELDQIEDLSTKRARARLAQFAEAA
jgi:hypothetical protein